MALIEDVNYSQQMNNLQATGMRDRPVSEKDHAVAMARRALAMSSCGCSVGDVQVLARQFLRALGLPER